MASLSVNVNKVATLRNSRGGSEPDVLHAIDVCIAAGAQGITIHPREDQRHITEADLTAIAAHLAPLRGRVELNVEGDPRAALMDRVIELRPDQCTLVPVVRGEITSQAGWPAHTPASKLRPTIARLQREDIRVSLFIDPDEHAVRWASQLGADRIELYTEPFAKAFARDEHEAQALFAAYAAASTLADAIGLGVNAGHDLNLDNLVLFRTLPHLDEVSIGHALITRALWVGMDTAVREYLNAIRTP